jgi:Holliday junction resolvase RusA-like endonuclease
VKDILRHGRCDEPAYLFWVDAKPTGQSPKGKAAYVAAVAQAARAAILTPIRSSDIEVEVLYSTTSASSARADLDNALKPTLDALKGIAYDDDKQVRSVTTTLFDRRDTSTVSGRVEHMGRLLWNPSAHVVLIAVYSDARLAEMGGVDRVRDKRHEEFMEKFDRDFRLRGEA